MKRIILSTLITALVITGLSCTPQIEYIEKPVFITQPPVTVTPEPEIIYIDRWHGPEVIVKTETIEIEVVREIEKIVYVAENTTYIPFESVSDMYDYFLSNEVIYREYKYGVYDCINYDPPNRYYGFALDFIEQARKDQRYFITDYIKLSSSKWHLGLLGFVGNRVYALDPNKPSMYPVLIGTAD